MVVAAYLAGLITTPAAAFGVLGGMWWWRRYRRTQADTAPLHLRPWAPPSPPPPAQEDSPVLNRMSMRSVPGSRRAMRRHRPR